MDIVERWRERKRKRLLECRMLGIMREDMVDINGDHHSEENGRYISKNGGSEYPEGSRQRKTNAKRLFNRAVKASIEKKYKKLTPHEESEINTYYHRKFADRVGKMCVHYLASSGTILFINRGYDRYLVLGKSSADVDAAELDELIEDYSHD